jgi:hypothetical protein
MPSTAVNDADIDAIFTEIEVLHAENKTLRSVISKLESRITSLETASRVANPTLLSSVEKRYKASNPKLPAAVSFIRNPEE